MGNEEREAESEQDEGGKREREREGRREKKSFGEARDLQSYDGGDES